MHSHPLSCTLIGYPSKKIIKWDPHDFQVKKGRLNKVFRHAFDRLHSPLIAPSWPKTILSNRARAGIRTEPRRSPPSPHPTTHSLSCPSSDPPPCASSPPPSSTQTPPQYSPLYSPEADHRPCPSPLPPAATHSRRGLGRCRGGCRRRGFAGERGPCPWMPREEKRRRSTVRR